MCAEICLFITKYSDDVTTQFHGENAQFFPSCEIYMHLPLVIQISKRIHSLDEQQVFVEGIQQ